MLYAPQMALLIIFLFCINNLNESAKYSWIVGYLKVKWKTMCYWSITINCTVNNFQHKSRSHWVTRVNDYYGNHALSSRGNDMPINNDLRFCWTMRWINQIINPYKFVKYIIHQNKSYNSTQELLISFYYTNQIF